MKSTYIINIILYSILYLINIESVFAVDRNLKSASDQVLTDSIGSGHYFQMFFGLFFIIVLILALAWLIKRVNNFQGGMNGVLKILSVISVGQREKVALIQVGEQQLLIGVSAGTVNTLLVLDEAVSNKITEKKQTNFSDRLSAVLKGKVNSL